MKNKIKPLLLIVGLIAGYTIAGTMEFEDLKKEEAYNCQYYPQAFDYCGE